MLILVIDYRLWLFRSENISIDLYSALRTNMLILKSENIIKEARHFN